MHVHFSRKEGWEGEWGEAKGREIGHPLSDLANGWAFLIPREVNEGHRYLG